ncbi:MAG: phosphoribosylaminoimidazolesuccinocarboxamide synthase [Caldilineaceae bacterium]|nr:phosphoribosylaminoimidazolesuccinocarboxamide synthase [Caldilineaceae bacterium]
MLDQAALRRALPYALDGVDLPFLGPKSQGKVRDIYRRGDELILVTTDRLSAFDRILGLVPYKGQVLNQLAAFWFEETQDILPNHLLDLPDPNVAVVRACTPLPVEVVVRGYISGVTQTALWYRYSQGERNIYGIDFPDGLHKNDPLPTPVITPTTKARDGGHDERITSAEIVSRGLIEAKLWEHVSDAAIAIFQRGQAIAQQGGLILVDTKYEFGVDAAGKLVLIDEVHTPDSSRFWRADTYASRHSAGEEPENFDKEFIRLYYVAQGYRGDGEPFPMPPELAVQAAERYITTYEMITQRAFIPGDLPAAPRIAQAMQKRMRDEG